ncbi:MAG: rod shape-determining protein MreC [Clostridia bacterium]|nr:rod shape-determining protein MreC [Clostridia bacterium]
MKFFKSKFFIITLIAAAAITVVFTAMSLLGYSSYIKAGLHYATVPVQKLSDAVGRAIDGYVSYVTEFDKLKQENEDLKKQLDEMLDEVQSAKAVREENDELRRMLEVKEEHLDYKFEIADIVGREDGNYMTVFTLGRGKTHGIDRDMPIISSNAGLIGRITDAGATWSKASSILDMGSSVGAYVERSRAPGIVTGEYELGLKGLCKLSYLQSDADVRAGDRILTSGVGSVYPRGLIIGTVTEVKYDESLRSKYAIIKPYANISELSSVTVVTSYEKYVEE